MAVTMPEGRQTGIIMSESRSLPTSLKSKCCQIAWGWTGVTNPEARETNVTMPEDRETGVTMPEARGTGVTMPAARQTCVTMPEARQTGDTMSVGRQTDVIMPEGRLVSIYLKARHLVPPPPPTPTPPSPSPNSIHNTHLQRQILARHVQWPAGMALWRSPVLLRPHRWWRTLPTLCDRPPELLAVTYTRTRHIVFSHAVADNYCPLFQHITDSQVKSKVYCHSWPLWDKSSMSAFCMWWQAIYIARGLRQVKISMWHHTKDPSDLEESAV